MGEDEAALVRLCREKRGEREPEDLSDVLVVQLGSATEDPQSALVRAELRMFGKGRQRHVRHPVIKWMTTLNGLVEPSQSF